MPRVHEFDFTGMEPAQGGGGSDYIPPGRYALSVVKVEMGKSKAGNDMVTATFVVGAGDAKGKRLVDYFTKSSSSTFGWQRLMAFFGALSGNQVKPGRAKIDLEKLSGLSVEADVADDNQAATADYAARTTSRISAYYTMGGAAPAPAVNGTTPTPAAVAAPAPQPAPAPATAPVAAAPEPVAAGVGEEIDDLFK